MSEPVKAWTLPGNADDLLVRMAALSRALRRAESGAPKNRAYARCRRWHGRWRSPMYTANGAANIDCSRCGMRWVW